LSGVKKERKKPVPGKSQVENRQIANSRGGGAGKDVKKIEEKQSFSGGHLGSVSFEA